MLKMSLPDLGGETGNRPGGHGARGSDRAALEGGFSLMLGDRLCAKCGQAIPQGEECPRCAPKAPGGVMERETLLILSLVAMVLLFAVTAFTARTYHAGRKALGEEWYGRGNKELEAKRAEPAVEDVRTALVYSRDNPQYQLRLAEALLAANRVDEAAAYLTSLREIEPENGTVNRELGRLAAGRRDVNDALRFYHDAIYGEWENDAAEQRQAARRELAEFLLRAGSRSEALGELMALAAESPNDSALHAQVGGLFLKAQDYDHALREFRQALARDPRLEEARVGAGEAAFGLSDYATARRYLAQATQKNPHQAEALRELNLANLVLELDPFAPQLYASARRQRVLRAFAQARGRLESCAQERGEALDVPSPETDLQLISARLKKTQVDARDTALRRDPDLEQAIMDLVFEVESLTARQCGPAAGPDEALFLIARQRGGDEL